MKALVGFNVGVINIERIRSLRLSLVERSGTVCLESFPEVEKCPFVRERAIQAPASTETGTGLRNLRLCGRKFHRSGASLSSFRHTDDRVIRRQGTVFSLTLNPSDNHSVICESCLLAEKFQNLPDQLTDNETKMASWSIEVLR